jgi:ribosomal-protein-alanine N-acetyltransferase
MERDVLMMPTLETPRLVLRAFTPDDAAALYDVSVELARHPDMPRFLGALPASVSDALGTLERGALRDYDVHGYGRHAVVLKETGKVIGFHGLKREEQVGETELGYRLSPAHWGKGLASEAAKVLVEHAWRGLGLPRIVSLIHPDNEASKNVARKLGMTMERRARVSFIAECEVEVYVLASPRR